MIMERIIPDNGPGDPRESGRRNRTAVRYLNKCATMRVEPDKHKLLEILQGRDRSADITAEEGARNEEN